MIFSIPSSAVHPSLVRSHWLTTLHTAVNRFTSGSPNPTFRDGHHTERPSRARAAFAAAVKRWPDAKITLRNGARIIEKSCPADD